MQVAAYEGYRTLRFERRGRVLRVTIDRPEVLNAVDDDMHEDLSHVFEEINRDEGCDVVVLTGAGKAFCAGGDARWLQSMIDEPARFRAIAPAAKRIVFSLLELEKPIICRLNGAAAGLGATIALMCDVITPLRRLAHELMDASIAYEMMTNLTADHQEAITAFREKRKPRFTGG